MRSAQPFSERRVKTPKKTRIYFACDVHGSEQCFRKFLNVAKYNIYSANVIMLSGDLTGKAIVAVVETTPGHYEIKAKGFESKVNSKDELEKAMMRVRNQGFYPKILSPGEFKEYSEDPSLPSKALLAEIVETMQHWLTMAEERLEGLSVSCYIMPGNDDAVEISPLLGGRKNIVNPEDRVVQLDEHHEMISLGFSNPTPWHTPRECTEEELSSRIDALAGKVKDMKNCIFNFHVPPYGSTLDSAPLLDENLRPRIIAGDFVMVPVGSTAVRSAIEHYQPLLGLHGHIHESSGFVKIGRTACLNAGSEYSQGILKGLVVDLDSSGVGRYLRVQG